MHHRCRASAARWTVDCVAWESTNRMAGERSRAVKFHHIIDITPSRRNKCCIGSFVLDLQKERKLLTHVPPSLEATRQALFEAIGGSFILLVLETQSDRNWNDSPFSEGGKVEHNEHKKTATWSVHIMIFTQSPLKSELVVYKKNHKQSRASVDSERESWAWSPNSIILQLRSRNRNQFPLDIDYSRCSLVFARQRQSSTILFFFRVSWNIPARTTRKKCGIEKNVKYICENNSDPRQSTDTQSCLKVARARSNPEEISSWIIHTRRSESLSLGQMHTMVLA